MRALLRDAEDQALIALEAEEAVYDPEDQLLLLYAASGTNYEVSRIVRAIRRGSPSSSIMSASDRPFWRSERI